MGSAACRDEVVEHVKVSLVMDHGLVVPERSVCEEVTSKAVAHGEMSHTHGASVMPNAH